MIRYIAFLWFRHLRHFCNMAWTPKLTNWENHSFGAEWFASCLSLASVKSRLVLPFWYRLTRVVPEKGPLNVCVCMCGLYHVLTLFIGRNTIPAENFLVNCCGDPRYCHCSFLSGVCLCWTVVFRFITVFLTAEITFNIAQHNPQLH